MLGDALVPEAAVRLPLATMNRHGLVAGATGTGKTRTLQVIAEQLSAAGVSVFAADVKGDVSGMAVPGANDGPAKKRATELGLPFQPDRLPGRVPLLGGIGPGVPVRATVSDFGPLLLAKVLERERDAGAEPRARLPLRGREGPAAARPVRPPRAAHVPRLGRRQGGAEGDRRARLATVGVLLRSLVALETGGGTEFFGEPQLDIADLMRTAPDGRGVISCLELPAVQDRPRLWSTVLMWLVAELFESLPEVGDRDKPKLVFFLDEAHLLFEGSSKAFVESVVQTVRLIRSKGVGVFFVTQTPKDIPADVLGQLGNRIQHALRAFTPDDEKALRATVRTYPKSDVYDLEQLLTQLGTGEAAVTILSESGVPTPVVHTRMRPPLSRMGLPTTSTVRPRRARSSRSTDASRQPERTRAARGPARPARPRREAVRADAPSEGSRDSGLEGRGRDRRLPEVLEWSRAHARSAPRCLRHAEEEPLVILVAFLIGLALSLVGIVFVAVRGLALWRQASARVAPLRASSRCSRSVRREPSNSLRRPRPRARSCSWRSSVCASRARGCRCCSRRSSGHSAGRGGCAHSCRLDDPRRSGRSRDELHPSPRRRRRRRTSSRRSSDASPSRGWARESTAVTDCCQCPSHASGTASPTIAASSRRSAPSGRSRSRRARFATPRTARPSSARSSGATASRRACSGDGRSGDDGSGRLRRERCARGRARRRHRRRLHRARARGRRPGRLGDEPRRRLRPDHRAVPRLGSAFSPGAGRGGRAMCARSFPRSSRGPRSGSRAR